MKKILLFLLMIVGCSAPAFSQYYISPTGSDSNAGTSTGAPWLTPNHAITCGQTITAAAGTYSSANFGSGEWGAVSCPSANNVAWLKCTTFDACKISATNQGIYITSSFWGVSGFEVTASGTYGTCFNVQSAINHVIFANNVANGCQTGGFSMNNGDYFVIVGNIAYNAAQGSAACTSGISIFEPEQSDTNAGTHMYVAGNYSYSNVNPSSCASTAPTDGEGIIFDTFNHEPYTQQVVAQNNILLGNGGRGIEVNDNTAATFIFKNNTTYGNNNQSGQLFPTGLGDITVDASNVTATGNIAEPATGTVGSNAIYAFALTGSSNTVSGNWLYGPTGNNTTGSGYGSNTTGTSPAFNSVTVPGAPSCGSYASVPACMATVISNFTPTTSGASAYGYQPISSTSVVNPLFPAWLCNGTALIAGFPSGIVTPGCGTSGATITPGMTTAQIQTAITNATVGSTVSFAAGTYSITTGLNLKCGVTYTGPVASPATAILSSTTGLANAIFNLYPGSGYALACTQPTAITYFKFANSGGIYVQSSYTNLTVKYNQFTNIPCCNSSGPAPGTAGLFFDGNQTSSRTTQNLTQVDIEWNQIGDSASCTSPDNAMTTEGNAGPPSNPNTETIEGNCVGIYVNTTTGYGTTGTSSSYGMIMSNNSLYHIGEGIHINCNSNGNTNGNTTCEPPSGGGNGGITNYVTAQFNDFNGIHRIPWEQQLQQTQGVVFQYNSLHDWIGAYYGSYGVSFACCDTGTVTPYLNVSSNVIVLNTAPGGPGSRYGYGSEDWGLGATYLNNWIGGNQASSSGMAWGFGGPPWNFSNNTVCGSGFASQGYIVDEGYGQPTPTQSGNYTSSTCGAVTSASPTIFPASGAQSFPLTVTLTDAGFTSGPQPLGNTSIYYTTDGSTPAIGQGTTQLYTGSFSVSSSGTVKAIGMWGTGANTKTYPSGFGFVASPVISATYTGGGTPTTATPVFSPPTQSFTGTLSVSVSDTTPSPTIYCTINGTTPTTSSPVYSSAFSLTTTTQIQCIATAPGYLQSAVGSGTYTVATPTLTGGSLTNTGLISTLAVGAPAIQFTAVGTYSDGVNRNLPDSFGNTAVWTSSNSGILTVGSTGLVSCAAAGMAYVDVSSAPGNTAFNPWGMTCTTSTPTAATPVISPASQTFSGSIGVSVTDSVPGAAIYYTTDGSTPTTSSTHYTGAFTVTATTTVNAIATATGYLQSAVGTATYTLSTATIAAIYLTLQGKNVPNYILVGKTAQFLVNIQYSDGLVYTSTVVGVANPRGDSISSWTTSSSGVATINTSGLMTAVALGQTAIQANVDGSRVSNPWYEYVSASVTTKATGITAQGVAIQ